MTLAEGDRLGRYEILGELGAGGMGEVYRARDTSLEREVAVKVLPEGMARDADRLHRFEREAKVVARLAPLGICTRRGGVVSSDGAVLRGAGAASENHACGR